MSQHHEAVDAMNAMHGSLIQCVNGSFAWLTLISGDVRSMCHGR